MAIYRVAGPDGAIYRIEGPDNATDEQVKEFAERSISAKQSKSTAPEFSTEDPGAGQAALIGTGRTLDRLAKGLKQSGLNIGALFGSDAAKAELGKMAQVEEGNTRAYEGLQRQHPVATFVGEAAPLVVAPIASGGIKAIAASAAIPGLMEYGTGEERLARGAAGAAGGAGGAMLARGVSRALKPTQSLPLGQNKVLEAADRLGVNLTAGEASGNRAMKWAESTSADLPFASGIASRRAASNDRAIGAAAAKAIGQSADDVSEPVLAAARANLSGEFSRILDPLKMDLKTAAPALKAVTGSKVLKSLRADGVDNLLKEIDDVAKSGPVDGAWFQQNKTALDMAIRSAYTSGKPGEAKALEAVEKALDRAAKDSMGAEDAAAYEAVRRQWANLRMLETGKVTEGGRVMPGRLDAALNTRYRGAYKEGKIKGELADIAALAKTIQGPPNSGTMPRAAYGGIMGGAAFVEPFSAAAMLAGPSALQGLAASPAFKSYMTKGALSLTPEAEKRLAMFASRGGLLGAYGASQ